MDSGLWSAIKTVREGREEGLDDFVSRTLPGLQEHFQQDFRALEGFYQKLGSSLDNLRSKDDFWAWCQQLEPDFAFSSEMELDSSLSEVARQGLQKGLAQNRLAPSIRRLPVRLMLSCWVPFTLYFFSAQQTRGIDWEVWHLAVAFFKAGCYALAFSFLLSPYLGGFREHLRKRSSAFSAVILGLFFAFVFPIFLTGFVHILVLLVGYVRPAPKLGQVLYDTHKDIDRMSLHWIWGDVNGEFVLGFLIVSILCLWPLCALVKSHPGVVNRAGSRWRKALSLPLILVAFYGLYQDAKIVYKGWEIDHRLAEFAVKYSEPDSTPLDPEVTNFLKNLDQSMTGEEKCRAWLEYDSGIWDEDEWWTSTRYRALVRSSPLIFWAEPTTAIEYEARMRASFAGENYLWLQMMEGAELSSQEWASLVELGQLAVRVATEEHRIEEIERFLANRARWLGQSELYFDDWENFQIRAHLNRLWDVVSEPHFSQELLEETLEQGLLFGEWLNRYSTTPRRLMTVNRRLLALEVKRMLSEGQVPHSVDDLPKDSRELLRNADELVLQLEDDYLVARDGRWGTVFRIQIPQDLGESDQSPPPEE